MKNLEIAWALQEIADLIELRGEDSFKAAAYRRAARALESLDGDVEHLYEEGRLLEISGVGKSIAEKMAEIITRGTCQYLEDLRRAVPPGLKDLMEVPGVGAKTASVIFRHLGISNLGELEKAAREKRLRTVPGLGPKKEMSILHGLETMQQRGGRTIAGLARPLAESLVGVLSQVPGVIDVSIAGSLRRWKETVGDIDLVAAAEDAEAVMDVFVRLPWVREVVARGETKTSVLVNTGRQADLRVVRPDQFVTALHHFTGSKEHNVRLRGRARDLGLKINEYGVFKEGEETSIPVAEESDIYASLKLPYIPPELREDAGEVEAAEAEKLPDLLQPGDIRGDLHCHTRWSDGVGSIADMAAKARSLGYEYLTITDHSRSLVIANGLSPERLAEQRKEIERAESSVGIRVLRGIEVDILKDGSLDLPESTLADLDVVTASIHTGFRQDGVTLTERVISAMKSPHVDIIGHPTGRLLGRRDPHPLDLERIYEVAAKTGTALELNASPDRLDLNDHQVRRAKEHGIKIAVNTDAHAPDTMEDMRYGVGQARRGWLEAGDVLNTSPWDELRRRLKR